MPQAIMSTPYWEFIICPFSTITSTNVIYNWRALLHRPANTSCTLARRRHFSAWNNVNRCEFKNDLSKFHPDPIWNDGAWGFLKRSPRQEQQQENKMSSERYEINSAWMRSRYAPVHAWQIADCPITWATGKRNSAILSISAFSATGDIQSNVGCRLQPGKTSDIFHGNAELF